MFVWSLAFLSVAILAALFGLGESTGTSAWVSEASFAISGSLLLARLLARPRNCQKPPKGKLER